MYINNLNGHVSKVNCTVPLYDGAFELTAVDGTASGHSTIELKWLPTPSIYYQLNIEQQSQPPVGTHFFGSDASNKVKLTFSEIGATVEDFDIGFPISICSGSSGPFHDRLLFGVENGLTSVEFWITNLPKHENPTLFAFGPWEISLTPVENLRELHKELKTTGGYALTHRGQLRREDNSPFAYVDADNALDALGLLLSFAVGTWVFPMLQIGKIGDTCVMHEWSLPRMKPWLTMITWAPDPEAERHLYRILGQGAYYCLTDPTWKMPVRVAVNWYIQTLDAETIDTGVVAVQAGLELLTYTHLVEANNHRYTDAQYKSSHFTFAKKLTEFLNDKKIPTLIPLTLPELAAMSAHNNLGGGGPEIVTYLRNSATHGNQLQRLIATDPAVRYYGTALGIWYLELLILSLFGYNGQYFDRTTKIRRRGLMATLPWVPPTT